MVWPAIAGVTLVAASREQMEDVARFLFVLGLDVTDSDAAAAQHDRCDDAIMATGHGIKLLVIQSPAPEDRPMHGVILGLQMPDADAVDHARSVVGMVGYLAVEEDTHDCEENYGFRIQGPAGLAVHVFAGTGDL